MTAREPARLTAQEWTVVALRALLSLFGTVVALVSFHYGLLFATAGGVLFAIGTGLVAISRYFDFRFEAECRRYGYER